WARRASDGVVGRARLDAETGIKYVAAWLAERATRSADEAERPIAAVIERLRERGARAVTYAEVSALEAEEPARAAAANGAEVQVGQHAGVAGAPGPEPPRPRARGPAPSPPAARPSGPGRAPAPPAERSSRRAAAAPYPAASEKATPSGAAQGQNTAPLASGE